MAGNEGEGCSDDDSDIQSYSDEGSSSPNVDIRGVADVDTRGVADVDTRGVADVDTRGVSDVCGEADCEAVQVSDGCVWRPATKASSRKRMSELVQLASTPVRHKVLNHVAIVGVVHIAVVACIDI